VIRYPDLLPFNKVKHLSERLAHNGILSNIAESGKQIGERRGRLSPFGWDDGHRPQFAFP
jgi:hypothetical protein